jgi:hypothetical protein
MDRHSSSGECQSRHALIPSWKKSNSVLIVVVVIPIALSMPAMCVFIPPTVIGAPAVLARFVKLMTSAFGLLTVITMMLDGFVQPVVGARDAALAFVGVGMQQRCSAEHQKAGQHGCGHCGSSEEQGFQSSSHNCFGPPLGFR